MNLFDPQQSVEIPEDFAQRASDLLKKETKKVAKQAKDEGVDAPVLGYVVNKTATKPGDIVGLVSTHLLRNELRDYRKGIRALGWERARGGATKLAEKVLEALTEAGIPATFNWGERGARDLEKAVQEDGGDPKCELLKL